MKISIRKDSEVETSIDVVSGEWIEYRGGVGWYMVIEFTSEEGGKKIGLVCITSGYLYMTKLLPLKEGELSVPLWMIADLLECDVEALRVVKSVDIYAKFFND